MSKRMGNTEDRARQFANCRGQNVLAPLGAGQDGTVFSTDVNTAIKVFEYEEQYQRERDVYLRLREHQLYEVCGCRIPRLIDFDDELQIVEMGIVQPPFVLDFVGAYLDEPPAFPDDVMEAWYEEKAEQFDDDWPLVQSIMATLSGYGIHLADVIPGNITLR